MLFLFFNFFLKRINFQQIDTHKNSFFKISKFSLQDRLRSELVNTPTPAADWFKFGSIADRLYNLGQTTTPRCASVSKGGILCKMGVLLTPYLVGLL